MRSSTSSAGAVAVAAPVAIAVVFVAVMELAGWDAPAWLEEAAIVAAATVGALLSRRLVRVEQRVREARALEEALRSLVTGTARSSAFDAALERARDVLSAEGCAVLVRDAAGRLVPRNTAGGVDADAAQALAELALSADAPVVERGRRAVPLHAGGEPVGVLVVRGGTRLHILADEPVAAVADLLGPALAHDLLNERLAERDRERGELFDLVVDAVERERQLLAHRLHDGPQQTMTAIRLMSDAARHALSGGDAERAVRALEQLEGYAVEAGDDLRSMTQRLHPVVMEQLGLLQALGSLAERIEGEYGVETTYEGPRSGWRTDPERDGALFAIAREAAINAARHGGPPIRIELDAADAIELRIVESAAGNGAGDRDCELGARLMAEAAERIGAEVHISDDGPRRIAVRLPVAATA